MKDIMKAPIVLQLNGNWLPVCQKTVAEAVIAMTSDGSSPAALALDIDYEKNSDGEYNFSSPVYMNPVSWSDWLDLPVRDFDLSFNTVNREIRVPTVLIAPAFRKMPTCTPRVSKYNIFERDGGICQYTGRKLSKREGNIDHVIPRDLGGKNTWDNLVWCEAELNSRKGNKLPHEVGLKLIRKPKAPPEMPIFMKFKEARRPEWIPFIMSDSN